MLVILQKFCMQCKFLFMYYIAINESSLDNNVSPSYGYCILRPETGLYIPWELIWTWKTWGFHGGDYKECRLLGYKNPVRTSQETHYFYVTESSQLMLCKIWGYHGGDYEECRLLAYQNSIRIWQQTHYVSITEPSRLLLRKIWGCLGGDLEECHLGCYAVWML
jgi:hypothetical protein